MRIVKAVLLGLLGIIVGLGIYDIVLTYTGYEYGLITSLIGTLTAAHVAFGYLGKKDLDGESFALLTWMAVFFALVGATAPYFVITSFRDGSELLFIAIGGYGGYEFTKYLWNQQHQAPDEQAVATGQKIPFGRKLGIYARKAGSIFSWYIFSTAAILLLGNFLFEGLGVSWVILVGLLIYELYKKQVFVITDEDLKD